ncbi:MAG: transposase [Ktedonobacteraceae bacterium]
MSSHLPHLSRPQAAVLALWSLGMVLTGSCGLSQVSGLLALLLDQKEETLRQRFREWYYPAKDKAGKHRRTLEVETCFAPLLRWVLAWWPESSHELALALDATTLGQRFTVLCISVLVRGCAIPVAWKVVAYNQEGSWQPYWEALLLHLEGVIPGDWTVLVLADRGLYAPWLYRQIVAQGWHPFLRINVAAKACLKGSDQWEWLTHWLPTEGEQWAERVSCFADKKNRLDCTLLICREAGYEEAWVVVTDLPPEQVHGAWYRLRAWIEGGFKDFKRGQWGWHHTKMLDPERAARLWLVLAVGTLWGVGVGSQAEISRPVAQPDQLPPKHIARQTAGSGTKGPRGRELSCLTRGRLGLIAAVTLGDGWPLAALWPEAWPESFPPAREVSAAKQRQRQKQRERQRVKRRKRKAARRAGKGKGKKAA